MIETRNLTRKFSSFVAVRNVNLKVPERSIFGFIGPNGAGKTTTMLMLATLLRPTFGEILVDGVNPLEDARSVRRKIGYLADTFGLYDELKVCEYLEYFCGAYEVHATPERIDGVLERVQLEQKRDELIGRLSRGMRQRLGIARTLVYDPQILLLDEPANALDPMARIILRDLLKGLRAKGTTIFISSHILTELSDFCDTVGIMEQGRLVASGSIEAILEATRTQFKLVLEVLHSPEKAREVLQDVPDISDIEIEGNKLSMAYHGGKDDLPALHRKLVEADLPVVAFFPKTENLEDLFMRLSTGATS